MSLNVSLLLDGQLSADEVKAALDEAVADPFLERFHGVDERVGVDALRWGLPVLYDVVRRFCGTSG